jgi:hypothetical protein
MQQKRLTIFLFQAVKENDLACPAETVYNFHTVLLAQLSHKTQKNSGVADFRLH